MDRRKEAVFVTVTHNKSPISPCRIGHSFVIHAAMPSLLRFLAGLLFAVLWSAVAVSVQGQTGVPSDAPSGLKQFDTDLSKTTIDLSELRAGGPSKDGIPSIDDPSFVSVDDASDWIDAKETLIVVERISHGDYFAFSWFAFRPNAALYSGDGGT